MRLQGLVDFRKFNSDSYPSLSVNNAAASGTGSRKQSSRQQAGFRLSHVRAKRISALLRLIIMFFVTYLATAVNVSSVTYTDSLVLDSNRLLFCYSVAQFSSALCDHDLFSVADSRHCLLKKGKEDGK